MNPSRRSELKPKLCQTCSQSFKPLRIDQKLCGKRECFKEHRKLWAMKLLASRRQERGLGLRECSRPGCHEFFDPHCGTHRVCGRPECRRWMVNCTRMGWLAPRPMQARACRNPECGERFEPYRVNQVTCRRQECIKWNRSHFSELDAGPRRIPEADLERILKAAEPDPSTHSLIAVAMESSFREGEQMGLTWDTVLNGEEFRRVFALTRQWSDEIQDFKPTKTRIARYGYLFDEGIAALRRYKEHLESAGRFDREQRIWPFCEATARGRFHRLQAKCKIRNPRTHWLWRWHDLRGTAAMRARENGADLELLKKLLGHSNANSTLRYLARPPEDIQKSLQDCFIKAKRTDPAPKMPHL